MSDPVRPFLREAFLLGERVLEVFFHTSSLEKYLQARAVFERVGLRVQHFRSTTDPYTEEYALGKQRLLTRAVDEIKSRVGRGTVFFVEDTSLRIEALSDSEDFPGLAVKEWFATTTFADLDAQLVSKGRDRRAIVKADIALHVPGLRRPVLFHGETEGVVASTPPSFAPSPQYPWLTPHTFNGWFIPTGIAKRLGEMSFEESWKYDFRVKALLELVNRLEEYAVVLNTSAPAYSRRAKVTIEGQRSLWQKERNVIVAVGRTCAGKTTFGERAAEHHQFRFLEASGVLRMLCEGEVDPKLSAFDAANAFLRDHGADVVARKILDILDMETDRDVIISGFRTVEELDLFKQVIPEARIVLVEASERTRFERHLARGRLDGITTIGAFRALDGAQGLFGLLRVAEDFADIKIMNEDSLTHFWSQVDAVITRDKQAPVSGITWNVRPRLDRDRSQTYHTLQALENAGRPLDCNEIDEATAAAGHRIRYNNANKVLKRIPGLAKRIDSPGMLVRYEIESAGRAYLRYMRRTQGDALRTTGG